MGGPTDAASAIDPSLAWERFESARDFTIAIEEEFALVDPASLELVNRFEEVYERCMADELLRDSAAGELIASEIEIRSGRAESFAEALSRQAEHRSRLFALAEEAGIALAATGTHPWASYLEQRIIDTPHYRRLRRDLGWVAWRNNTWSVHVHVGIRGADRAIAVCDHLRGLLPPLLAASASSPFLDGRDTGLDSVRTQIFTRMFPRCGVPDAFGDWRSYASFIELLRSTGSVREATQLWWSVRPHHMFGTVEVRICDAQIGGEESFGLAGLTAACIAQAALDHDEGTLDAPLRPREVEENLWRAIRHGLDGEMIDFRRGTAVPTRSILEGLVEWTEPARDALGIEARLPERTGARRQREALAAGRSMAEVYRETIEETRRTYAPQSVADRSPG